jgi:hypothetical protein
MFGGGSSAQPSGRYATGRTLAAWGPFGPSVTSNSTFWFFIKAPVALTLDGAGVHEHVRTVLPGDEGVPLVGVEPLQRSQLPQQSPPSVAVPDLGASDRPPAGSPGRELLEARTGMLTLTTSEGENGPDPPGVCYSG